MPKPLKPSNKSTVARPDARPQPELHEPVDVVDGIPDRSGRSGKWILILLAAIFLAWMAFLIAVKVLGSA